VDWTFEIPGPPVAKERPRRAPAGHFYTPTKTKQAEQHVAECAMAAGVHMKPKTLYAIEIDFYLSAWRRDMDNCEKLLLDGLQKLGDGWDDRYLSGKVTRIVSVLDAGEEKTVVRLREDVQVGRPDTGPVHKRVPPRRQARVGA